MSHIKKINNNVTVTVESDDGDVPEPDCIASIVQQVLDSMGCANAEINIHVVDDRAIRSLNRKYRNQDKSTNVLSFAAQLPEWVQSNFLGDIVLCPTVIREEAAKYRKSKESRWAHMLIHGTLHLLGQSHDNEHQQTEMETAELKIMAELGFDDPYRVLT